MAKVLREPFSAISHLIGTGLAIFALVLMILRADQFGNVWHTVSFSIFGASLILLYLFSTLYHLLPLSPDWVQFFKRLDHMMIFVLIAGSYTPYCLIPLRGAWGWTLLALIWSLAISGIILKLFWLYTPRWLTVGMYLFMGWLSIVAIYPVIITVPRGGLMWLSAAGLIYTFGAVIYAFKWPDPFPQFFGFHEVWHLFIMAASFCHFWSVYQYLSFLP